MLGEIVVCTCTRNEQTSQGFSPGQPRESSLPYSIFAMLSRSCPVLAFPAARVLKLTKEIE
jgi:hypothetical protein